MPNPRAQKPLTLDQIALDAKSLGIPITAMMDMLAGGLKGSTTQTVGGLADIANAINQFSFRGQLPEVPYGSEELSNMTPDVVPNGNASRKHSAEYGQTMGGFVPTPMAGQALKGAVKLGAKGARALGEEAGRRAVMGESFTPFVNTAIPQTNVVKPEKGGAWLDKTVDRLIDDMRPSYSLDDKLSLEKELKKHRDYIEQNRNYELFDLAHAEAGARDVEDLLKRLPAYSAVHEWLNKNLRNYIKNEMGTPSDPLRKLADEKNKIHLEPSQLEVEPYIEGVKRTREEVGMPVEGMAKTPMGKSWEDRADLHIESEPASYYQKKPSYVADFGQFGSNKFHTEEEAKKSIEKWQKSISDLSPDVAKPLREVVPTIQRTGPLVEHPWLEKKNPNEIIYNLDGGQGLNFKPVTETILNDIIEGRLPAESLKNVSVAQAVARHSDYQEELARKLLKLEEEQQKKNLSANVHKEYDSGHKWIELPDTMSSAENKEFCKGIGKNLGLCTQNDWAAEDYGRHDVGNRLYALIDQEGKPHAQIQTKHRHFNLRDISNLPAEDQKLISKQVTEWAQNQDEYPTHSRVERAYSDAAKSLGHQLPTDVLEIKPPSNDWKGQYSLDREEKYPGYQEKYKPFLDDFVRSGNYGEVGDLYNTNLFDLHKSTQYADDLRSFANKVNLKLPRYLLNQEADILGRHSVNHRLAETAYPESKPIPELPEELKKYQIQPEPPVQEYKEGGAVQRFDDGGEVTKTEDLFKPFFGNPNIQKQGAIARQNALERTPDKVADPKTYGAVEAGLGVLGGMVNPLIGGAYGIAKSIPEAIRTKQPPAPLASKYAEEYIRNNPLGEPETEKGKEYSEDIGKLFDIAHLPPVAGDLTFAHNVGTVAKPVNMMLKDYFKANPPSVGLGTKDVSGLPPEKYLKPKTAKDLELENLHDELKAKIKEDGPAINAFEDIAYDDKLPVESQKHIPKSVEDIANLENMFNMAKGRVWNKGRDLKEAMQNALKEHTKGLGVDTSLESPETHDYLARMGVRDATTALDQNPNAVGWYDQKTRQALDIMSLLHPEIATDPNAKTAFVWAMAVTSNGLKVNKNFELANQAYELYKKNKVMPNNIGIGTAGGAINEGLDLYNKLKKQWGPDNLRKFMDTDFTVGEISAIDKDLKPTGEHSDVRVKGSSILGPKIGNGFYSNLNGNFDSLTMDRWLVRTWGRWTGTLLEEMPKQTSDARNRMHNVLQDVLKSPEETQKFADLIKSQINGMHPDDFSQAVQEASMLPANRDIMNNTPLGEEARKAGNSLAKYLDAQKEAPAGPTERKFIRRVFSDVLHELRKDPRYKDLSMADLQASLWYAEKRLYETAKEDIHTGDVAGYEDESAPDYANAARDLVLSKGVSQRKIDNLLKRGEENARTRATRLEGLEGTETDRGEQGASRGLTESEKRTFKEEHATKHIRSNKQGNDAPQWTYTRRGDEPSRGPRVLKSLGVTYEGEWQLGPKGANAFRRNGIPTPNIYELDSQGGPKTGPSNAERFAQSIAEAKESNPHGASVNLYSPEEYANMRLFLTRDGKAGVAIKPDGDIVSVFKHKDAPTGTARSLLELAVEAGGRKLDAFDTILPDIYSAHGFKAVSRTPWADKHAPEGWDKAKYKKYNRGEPDIVYMVYDPAHFGFHEDSHGKVFKGANNQTRAVNLQNRTADLISTQRKPITPIPATPPMVDRINMAHKDVTKRVPELTEGAKQLFEGKLSNDDYTKLVNQYKPITPYEFVPALATPEEMASALNKNQLPKLMASRSLPEGYPVAVRLDIPAYTRHNIWIPTIHEPKAGFMAGPPIGYDSFSSLTNAELGVVPKSAELYATGRTDKNTFATIKGNWKKMTPEDAQAQAQKYLKDKKWTQVGMDPERHSYFYDRKTGNPVTHADEILQVGPLVLAKNAKNMSKKGDFAYKTGGAVQVDRNYGVGGAIKKIAEKLGTKIIPMAETEANKAKFLEPSQVKEVLYRGQRRAPKPNKFITTQDRATPSFTTDPEVANVYSQQLGWDIAHGPGSTSVPVHVQMEKPFDIRKLGEHLGLDEFLDQMDHDLTVPTHPQKLGYEDLADILYTLDNNVFKGGAKHTINSIDSKGYKIRGFDKLADEIMSAGQKKDVDRILYDLLPDASVDAYALADNPYVVNNLKKLGYDSIIHKDVFDAGMPYYKGDPKKIEEGYDAEHVIDAYRPLHQNKIKSAIGNQGTYDTTNPDITKKRGGAVQSLKTNLPVLPKHDDFVAKHHLTPDNWIKRK